MTGSLYSDSVILFALEMVSYESVFIACIVNYRVISECPIFSSEIPHVCDLWAMGKVD